MSYCCKIVVNIKGTAIGSLICLCLTNRSKINKMFKELFTLVRFFYNIHVN